MLSSRKLAVVPGAIELRQCQETKFTKWLVRPDRVVPLSVETVRVQAHGRELGVGHLPAYGVAPTIEPASHLESFGGGGRGNQAYDGFVVTQRLAAPVCGDEREQPVLHLVPLARAWGEVAYTNRDPRIIGNGLQLELPEPWPITVAAAPVSRDQQAPSSRIEASALCPPPPVNRGHSEGRRVMVSADTDKASVPGQVVDPIWVGSRDIGRGEVVHADLMWRLERPPLLSRILVVAEELLLLGVDRDHRALRGERLADFVVDESELGVPVWVLLAFTSLPRSLEAVAGVSQQLRHGLMADRMASRRQLRRQRPCTLVRPTQGRLRVPSAYRLNQRLQAFRQVGIAHLDQGPSPTRAPHATRRQRGLVQFPQPFRDRDTR